MKTDQEKTLDINQQTVGNCCILCGSDAKDVIANKTTFDMPITNVVCRDCGFVYQSPRLTEEFLDYYYSQYNYLEKNYKGTIKSTFDNMSSLSNDRLDFLRRNNVFEPISSILEIGCGCGSMLHAFSQESKRVKGIEIDQKACDFIREDLKLDVICSNFEKAEVNETYDLVALMHVLEHVSEPKSFIQKIMDCLNDDGYVYFEVPNIRKPLPDGPSFYRFFDPGHLYSFSPKSIKVFLEKYGLEVIHVEEFAFQGRHHVLSCLAKKATAPIADNKENYENADEVKKRITQYKILHPIHYWYHRIKGFVSNRIFKRFSR